MARLICICSALLICLAVTVPCAEARFQKYLSLISDVQKHYHSASVCLLLPHKDRPSHEFSLAYNLTRHFSRKKIGTVMIRYNETMKLMDSYGKDHRRPLLVVLLRSVKDVADFSKGVQNIKISYPIWLVIFTNEFDTPICVYCNRPMGNKFGLRFDTQMLILCCKYPIIKEWWTFGDNETQVGNFGRWTVGNRFKVVVNHNLYKRRNQLGGIKLRAVMKESNCEDANNDTPKEFILAVLKELKNSMNFTLTFACEKFQTDAWKAEAVMYVSKGRADFLVEKTLMTTERSEIVDFTLPLLESNVLLVVKDIDSSSYQISTYFKVFTYPVWLAIISLIIGSAAFLVMIERTKGRRSFVQNFCTNTFNLWGIFCSQGLPEEFIQDGSYDVIIRKFGETYKLFTSLIQNLCKTSKQKIETSTTLMKLQAMMRPAHRFPLNFQQMWKQVCNEKVAGIVQTAFWNISALNHLPCKVRYFEIGIKNNIAMAMPPGNQYTALVNFYLQAFRENGIMKRLKNKYSIKEPDVSITPVEVSAKDVAPLFLILAGGMVLALLILVLEKLYAPFRKSQLEKQRRKAILERSYWRRRVIERKKRRRSLWRRLLRL